MKPKAGDGISDAVWLPEIFNREGSEKAIGYTEWASPFFMHSEKFGYRAPKPEVWPFPGVGGLVIGVSGCTLIFTWPMASTIDQGSGIRDCLGMIGRLTNVKATGFLKSATWAAVKDQRTDTVVIPLKNYLVL